MATQNSRTAEEDLLKDAVFDPIFDQNGNLVDIVRLEVANDRSRGILAMEELAATHVKGDEVIHQDGWTGYMKRILNSPAPGPAHTIKQSKKWDVQTSTFIPAATLMLPYEVVWSLFTRLFFGNYSIETEELVYDSEDVVNSPAENARNLTGRAFYARAKVNITIHLPNGQSRKFSGVGVAYDSLRDSSTGNIYAINSARRMCEKGAVSDAKREALSNIGRVFNRAYEDGAHALRAIEEKILEKVRQPAQNTARVKTPTNAAAPRANEENRDDHNERQNDEQHSDLPSDYIPMEAIAEQRKAQVKTPRTSPAPKGKVAKTSPAPTKAPHKETNVQNSTNVEDTSVETPANTTIKEEAKDAAQSEQNIVETPTTTAVVSDEDNTTVDTVAVQKVPASVAPKATEGYALNANGQTTVHATPEDLYEAALNGMEGMATEKDRQAFLERNKTVLLQAENDAQSDDVLYVELESLVPDLTEESSNTGLPAEEEEEASDDYAISPRKETGEAILMAYEQAFQAKKDKVDQILMANIQWAKRLTARQKMKLAEMATAIKIK